MRKIISLLLVLCLLAGCSLAWAENPELTEGEQKALDNLAQVLEKDAERQIAAIGEVTDLYPVLPASFSAGTDSFPEKFDLRERGIMTPVKSQMPWGTCWTFGTSAACETSLLTMLGVTAEEFKTKYGVDMDLSERHLAWFAAMPLPEVSEYPEGEYPYDASQAGEGGRMQEGGHPLMTGGSYMLSASSLASGIGVVAESIAPYEANDELPEGETDLRKGDWSLPEQYRFVQSFQLKNANVLPSPAGTDADGNYVYRPEGTAAIKRELIRGRAVAAAYLAGPSGVQPEPSKETRRANYEAELFDTVLSDEEKETLIQVLIGDLDPMTLADELLRKFVQVRCELYMIEEGTYTFSDLSHEDLALLAKTNYLGTPVDEINQLQAEAEEKRVRFFSDGDPVIWAQYSNKVVQPDHATCIIGWDDTFPASFFPENHRPPADGAWICRNSYGTDWGMEGYFYLSYYDRSFGMPQTFEFANDADMQKIETFGILQYDYMPAEMISATLYAGLRGQRVHRSRGADGAPVCIGHDRRTGYPGHRFRVAAEGGRSLAHGRKAAGQRDGHLHLRRLPPDGTGGEPAAAGGRSYRDYRAAARGRRGKSEIRPGEHLQPGRKVASRLYPLVRRRGQPRRELCQF